MKGVKEVKKKKKYQSSIEIAHPFPQGWFSRILE